MKKRFLLTLHSGLRLFAAVVPVALGARARLFLVIVLWSPSVCPAQPNWVGAGAKMSNATITYYAPKEFKPLLTLHAGQVYGDYQTRGFFRIGVLPLLVVDGLEVELHDAQRSFNALTNTPALLGKNFHPGNGLEIRRFSLSLAESRQTILTAQSVHVVNGAAWKLGSGSFLRPDGGPVVFRRAWLTVAGTHAGEIVCETGSGNMREWLQLSSLTKAEQKINP